MTATSALTCPLGLSLHRLHPCPRAGLEHLPPDLAAPLQHHLLCRFPTGGGHQLPPQRLDFLYHQPCQLLQLRRPVCVLCYH